MLLPWRWRKRLTTVLEWSAVDKALIMIALLIPLYFQYLLWSFYVFSRSDRDRLIHVDLAQRLVWIEVFLIFAGSALVLIGLMIRKRWPDLMLFQYVALQFYGLSLVAVSYPIGTMSFCCGIVLLGAPIFGFILLDRVAVWLASLSSLVAVVGLSYATAYDYLPYAPVRVPPSDQSSTLFWMNSTLFFAAPFLVFFTFMADQLLAWWREREARIHKLSRTDALTGLHNRRSILDLLEQEVARAQRQQQPLSVVILDLDHFKKINDTWGHPTGDRVLQTAARVLGDSVRSGDHVGRYGGEEFMLILPGVAENEARQVLERCRQQLVAEHILSDNQETLGVSASFGLVCQTPAQAAPPQRLIQCADEALYQAKALGRNRIECQALTAAMAV